MYDYICRYCTMGMRKNMFIIVWSDPQGCLSILAYPMIKVWKTLMSQHRQFCSWFRPFKNEGAGPSQQVTVTS